MKILTNAGIYIQKKDLDLILSITSEDKIPSKIINQHKQNINMRDLDFVFFEDKEAATFLNSFWFVINYNDIIDFDDLEIDKYSFYDSQNLLRMRKGYEKGKALPEGKVYNDYIDMLQDVIKYCNYMPTRDETKQYPLEFQLLYNKVSDVMELKLFKRGGSDLELPEGILKPVNYSRKQLQQIYYGVLSEELTFEELKPYEKQLYSIFSRINYTPDVLEIIRKLMLLNRFNTLDFINDELLDVLLHVEGKVSKFEESKMFLIDYLYVIGYNNREGFDSKIILEKDLRRIKKTISYIAGGNWEENDIKKLAKYNNDLASIIPVLKKSKCVSSDSETITDAFFNILTFVYMNPNAINNNYAFLLYVDEYLASNMSKIEAKLCYDLNAYDEKFVENFNKVNSLLLKLYAKYKNNKAQETCKLSEKIDFYEIEK